MNNEVVEDIEGRGEKGNKWYKGVISSLVIGLLAGVLFSNFVVGRAVVDGLSMYPTLETGDVLIINKLDSPERGDIVTFRFGDMDLVKRVIAVPGDSITCIDSEIYVNGEKLEEDYINEKVFKGGTIEDTIINLGEGQYFVMGDNRNNSMDSRSFGIVDEEDIIGVSMF